jgi:hypothetical protein
MRCLLWYREKKNKEPKLFLSLKGLKKDMVGALASIHECLWKE